MIDKVNLETGFASFEEHAHDVDEPFLVVAGKLRIELPDQEDLVLEPSELAVVPAGIQHRPVASQNCQVVLFERRGTVNTGDRTDLEGTPGRTL